MVSVGYAKAYANSYCGKMWENKSLIKAIARIDAKTAIKCELSAEKVLTRLMILAGLEEAAANDVAKPSTTDAGQIRSLDLLGKHLKLWDRAGESDQADAPKELTQEQLDELNRKANIQLSQESA